MALKSGMASADKLTLILGFGTSIKKIPSIDGDMEAVYSVSTAEALRSTDRGAARCTPVNM